MYHGGNQLLDPYIIFDKVHLRDGMHTAVFGVGRTGHLVFPAARVVGERGMVYAVDILKENLKEIHKRALLDNLINVHTVWADVEKLGSASIPERTVDAVLMVNLLVHVQNRETALAEAARLIKDKGRIVVVDWVDTSVFKMNRTLVDFDRLLSWSREHNFALQEDFMAGKYHRGIVMYRHD